MDYKMSVEMQNDVRSIKNQGQHPKLVVASAWYKIPPYVCKNCDGTGQLMIEYFTGGPSRVPLHTKEPEATTFYDGSWYKRRVKQYTCPICHGEGGAVQGVDNG